MYNVSKYLENGNCLYRRIGVKEEMKIEESLEIFFYFCLMVVMF